jgi:hypothetical protein
MFDQTPRPPNGRYLSSYSHKQAIGLIPTMITSWLYSHGDAAPTQPTNRTPRARMRRSGRPRSSRHEPQLSTRIGRPLDYAPCCMLRSKPPLLDLTVEPDRLLHLAQNMAASALLPAGSAAQNAATPTFQLDSTHSSTMDSNARPNMRATATQTTPDAAAGLDAHQRELQQLLHDVFTDTTSSTPRRATNGSQTRPTCTHTP